MVFIPIILNYASHVTRLMLTEFATEKALSILEKLSNRKQFLGISGESVENFITTKIDEGEASTKMAENSTLDFMMSFFPTDIDFRYLTKIDARRNSWKDIVNLPKVTEKDSVPLDFISFSGNNAVFENAFGNFEALLNDEGDEPFIKEELLATKNKLWEIRNNLLGKELKLLAHSHDNSLIISVYSPGDIENFRDDLEVYLKSKHSPFGAIISIIKIGSSINNRKVGLVENGFINGNLNSTFDLITSKLKVSPPMKAIIDDSYRKKILASEDYSTTLWQEYGFVMDAEGGFRLPNVTDYMFIPAAILDVAETLNDVIISKVKASRTKLINVVTSYTIKASKSRFRGFTDKQVIREEMTSFMQSEQPVEYVKESLENRAVPLTLNGVQTFVNSWKEVYNIMNNQGSAYVNLIDNLVIDLGFSGYGISSNEDRYWISAYIRRMDSVPFLMQESRPTKMAEFFKGLAKVVKDLDASNILTFASIDTADVVDDYIADYDAKFAYDIRTKKKVKNKKLAIIKRVLATASRAIGDGTFKAESGENMNGDAKEKQNSDVSSNSEEKNHSDDILNDVVGAK